MASVGRVLAAALLFLILAPPTSGAADAATTLSPPIFPAQSAPVDPQVRLAVDNSWAAKLVSNKPSGADAPSGGLQADLIPCLIAIVKCPEDLGMIELDAANPDPTEEIGGLGNENPPASPRTPNMEIRPEQPSPVPEVEDEPTPVPVAAEEPEFVEPPTPDVVTDGRVAAADPAAPSPDAESPWQSVPANTPSSPVVASWHRQGVVVTSITVVLWGLAYLFTRLKPPQVIGLPTRRRIVENLRSHPWSSLSTLAKRLEMRRTTLAYHIRVLRRHGQLRSMGAAKGRRFALAVERSPPPQPRAIAVLESATRVGPRRLSELMRLLSVDLGISRVGAWKTMRAAASAGHVRLVREGAHVWVLRPNLA